MLNKDIDFYQTSDVMPIKTEHVDNSEKGYKVNDIRDGFKLVIIRKYIYGFVYIWRQMPKIR